MNRMLMLVGLGIVGLASAFAQDAKPKSQVPPPPSNDVRAKDRTAIRDALASFTKSFEARDAKQVAAHWTAEGEHQTVHGDTVRGRDALEKGFSEFFAATPEVQAEIQPESLRFLSKDSAIEDGIVTIRKGDTEAPTHARYHALLVREEEGWRFAMLSESPGVDVTIRDLEWLIGEWKSLSPAGADIRTTYTWDANKKFIQVEFRIKTAERTLTGKQVIGVDPATGHLHSWTFEANGGVGEADWSRDGDHWILDATGTLPDGSTLKESNILRRVDADTLTWQSTSRTFDDHEIPDLAPIKVIRIKTEK